jgi:hypothetical protein
MKQAVMELVVASGEATHEIDRLQAFRMREFMCMGPPDPATDFRDRWMAQAPAIAESLGLTHHIAPASDPFFGRTARLIAQNQLDQALKFELLIPVRSAERPTACMTTVTATTSRRPSASRPHRARPRTPPASPSAWTGSRSRCSRPTGSIRHAGRRRRAKAWGCGVRLAR